MPEVEIRFSVVADQAAEQEGNQRSVVRDQREFLKGESRDGGQRRALLRWLSVNRSQLLGRGAAAASQKSEVRGRRSEVSGRDVAIVSGPVPRLAAE